MIENERQKQLTQKVKELSKRIDPKEPSTQNFDEWLKFVENCLYKANIENLKEFLVDRKGQGEKPRLIVSTAYKNPKTGKLGDVLYKPDNTPENHQVILEELKKQQFIPDDSTISDYQFLFSNEEVQ